MLRIKKILKEQGKTQIDLANELSVSPIGLNKMINGNPTLETLQKIANVLNVEVVDLFNHKNNDNVETIYALREGVYVPVGELKK
ncbi:helix-turn-helix domain-containing protein [Algibacter sp. PT7-4]|uniref:helix-turn-helix domain-containing protein n=1 Tax=Algibacter ulvanivorans TaxID=3400999 RepID=UPI003AAA4DC7